jgi:hypothetical protein
MIRISCALLIVVVKRRERRVLQRHDWKVIAASVEERRTTVGSGPGTFD